MRLFFLANMLTCMLLFGGCATASDINAPSELNPFSSDGCSLFPDGTLKDRTLWLDCCFNHDIAYWRGGSADERKEADSTLRACVIERTGNKALAAMMYDGVRAGGSPIFPTWYRWGYGWKYGRGYKPLSGEEKKQVEDRLAEYRKAHPSANLQQQ